MSTACYFEDSSFTEQKTLWGLRPMHTRKFAQFSREWFEACDRAFVKAMEANPDVRPDSKPGDYWVTE